MRAPGVSAIVLAAGAGSRFGGGKLLAELAGVPLIEHALAPLERSPVDDTVVVVAAGDTALRMSPFMPRPMEQPARGQSSSVRVGLCALGPEARAAVVLLADQPRAGAAVGRLVEAFESGARIAVATYSGEPRNPVLFSREVWPLLHAELEGDRGARPILQRHPELLTQVPCDDLADPADVDTREDLKRLHRRERNYKMG